MTNSKLVLFSRLRDWIISRTLIKDLGIFIFGQKVEGKCLEISIFSFENIDCGDMISRDSCNEKSWTS